MEGLNESMYKKNSRHCAFSDGLVNSFCERCSEGKNVDCCINAINYSEVFLLFF